MAKQHLRAGLRNGQHYLLEHQRHQTPRHPLAKLRLVVPVACGTRVWQLVTGSPTAYFNVRGVNYVVTP